MRIPTFLAVVMLCSSASAARGEIAAAVLRAEAERVAVMHGAKDAVLAIFAAAGQGGGSGVVISADGYALTNFHVAKPCGNAMKCGMADGRVYDAVIVGLDPTGDVAMIQLFGRDDFPHAELANSDQVRMGDWCFAMGNPFLLATDFLPTATYGIVSGVHRYQYPSGTLLEYTDCIQTDASINPGNSGGPLFDAQGRLIGINGRASFEKRGRVNVGVAYAISINQVKNFLGYLHSGRIVDHATLGAVVNSDEQGRVLVSDILQQSDAYRRGLRHGDEIVSFGGRPISTPNGFKNVLGILPKGWRVPLSYRRDGKRYDILVRLQGVHGKEELLEKAEGGPKIIPMPIPKPGEKPKPTEKPRPGQQPKPSPPPTPDKEPTTADGAQGADKPKSGQQPKRAPGMQLPRLEAPMPAVCKQHFEAKRGYANYYFNRWHRDRVMKAWTDRCDLRDLDGTWTLSGELRSGGRFRFQLSDDDGALKLPNSEIRWEATEELGSSLAPPQSGGLMPALYVWRRLAVLGPGKFDEAYYLGTVPLAGHQGLVDVLVGLYRGVECHFMFDPVQGHLLAMEMYPEEDADPCEVYFSEYREVDGRFLPGRMDVCVGDDPYGTFKLLEFHFDKTANKER
jgi:S1-C subfamily serine protease